MEVLDIECHEAEVAELAESLNLTFYDASYIFLAKSKGMSLVTEDKDIKNRVRDYIKVLSIGDF